MHKHKNISTRWQIFLHFLYLLGALLLLIIAGVTHVSFRSLLEKDFWVEHTTQVMYTAEKELSFLKDAETGERGYVITGDSTYLQPYFNSLDSVDYYLLRLKSLTKDNLSQQVRIDSLQMAVNRQKKLLANIIRLKNNNQEPLLSAHFKRYQGKASMDDIRRRIQAVMEEEKRLLALRVKEYNRIQGVMRSSTYLIILISLLVDLFLVILLRRKLAQKAAYEKALGEKNEALFKANQDLQQIQQQLEDANQVLESRVGERTQELRLANGQLSKALAEEQKAKAQEAKQAGQFVQLLESLPAMAWTAGPAGNRLYFNRRMYAYTEASFEKLKDWGWLDYLHPLDVETTRIAWREGIQNGQPIKLINRWKRACDQSFRWHLTRAEPLRDEKGEISLWVGTSTDINDEKIQEQFLEQSNKRLELQNRIGSMLAAQLELSKLVQEVTDVTTQISGAQFGAFFYNTQNEKGEHMTLYTLSGAPIEAFSHYPLPRFTAIFAPTFRGEGIIRSDDITQDERYGKNAPYQGMPKDHLPVKSYLAIPVISRTGKVLGGLFFGHSQAGIFTQESEQLVSNIASQASIAIDNAFLFEASLANRKELALINQQLEKTNKELLQTNTDLDNFIYTASHDLRAPIANMEGLTTLLIKKLAPTSREEERKLLGLLEYSVSKLKQVIKDLTEITKVQKEWHEQPERVDFEEITREVVADIGSLVEETGVKIQSDFQIRELQYSKKNLRSILYNLLSNAIKYRSSERQAEVNMQTKEAGEYVLLVVKDNGLGIASDQIHKLFTMFKRLHTHVEGTGIGLYIVKRIIENRGGYIEVESQLGEGTTFYVYFAKENQ